jgi:uncharacterized BrkB/YihY/UPF0761 family membrane protein
LLIRYNVCIIYEDKERTGLKIRKMFVLPLYIFILLLKYTVLVALIKFELALVFGLFKPLFMMDKTGWSGLLLVIVVTGLDLAIYFLILPRLPIKWEQFEPKKLAEKILRLDEI